MYLQLSVNTIVNLMKVLCDLLTANYSLYLATGINPPYCNNFAD